MAGVYGYRGRFLVCTTVVQEIDALATSAKLLCTYDFEMTKTESAQAFIERWQGVMASELATAQSFVMELCDLLDGPGAAV